MHESLRRPPLLRGRLGVSVASPASVSGGRGRDGGGCKVVFVIVVVIITTDTTIGSATTIVSGIVRMTARIRVTVVATD
jgi:hypothetical protein